jgi:hypothetical protein
MLRLIPLVNTCLKFLKRDKTQEENRELNAKLARAERFVLAEAARHEAIMAWVIEELGAVRP